VKQERRDWLMRAKDGGQVPSGIVYSRLWGKDRGNADPDRRRSHIDSGAFQMKIIANANRQEGVYDDAVVDFKEEIPMDRRS
jgi:hypothetical protein